MELEEGAMTGQYLTDGSDEELYVLSHLGNFLFCLAYSQNHQVFTLKCYTVQEVERWGYTRNDYEPEWLCEDLLMEWQQELTCGYGE